MLPNRASLAQYGGAIENYSAVIDPKKDEDAKFRNFYVTDTAMMTHTAPKAVRSFVAVDNLDPTDPPTGFVHDAQWGDAPSVKPSAVRLSEGNYDVTWPVTVDTELKAEDPSIGGGDQATIAVNIRRAIAQVECSDGTLRHAVAQVTAANKVRVRTFLANGTADDLPGQIITVWIW